MILPKINKIIIENFSLYKQQRRIEVEVPNGVLCLAGANGLGKSTFISIVSYAMTGAVVQPDISFKSLNSIPAFAQKTVGFASRYFDGRIEQRDREQSQVTVDFNLGNFSYHLIRNFFDSSELIEFSRINNNHQETVDRNKSLLNQYQTFFIQDTELNNFEQYLFLQTYVMTFDESKKLLFWDEDVMNRLMYLFFSIKPEDAEKADQLRKNINRYGSNVRNIQWNISQMEKRLSKLKNNGTITEEEKNEIERVCEEEEEINNTIEEERKRKQEISSDLSQVQLQLDNNAVKLNALKEQYDAAFGRLYSSPVAVESDGKIQGSLKKIIVALTEDENTDITALVSELRAEIVDAVKRTKAHNEQAILEQLKALDSQMIAIKSSGKELKDKYDRMTQELAACLSRMDEMAKSLELFKQQYNVLLQKKDSIKQSEQTLSEIKALELNIELRKKEKAEAEQKRDECQSELKPLEDEVKRSFTAVAEQFIPSFRDYAKSFIGLDIDIELKDNNNMASLVIKVNGSDRHSRFQLSESQQYFLDIALRFSLLEYTKSENAFMLIDTPEGSLDIAYESRAGKMFADFVAKGYSVIMTANINTSQLLLKLAEMCGKDKMKVERMTEWTILTQVQQEEQEVIEQAYNQIESRLLNQYA
jgi:DNA repair exonuclease SbcCD ATPase subunit